MKRIVLAALLALASQVPVATPVLAATQSCRGAAACQALAQRCAQMGGRYSAGTTVNGQVTGTCTTR
jgi:hypothetical protein